LTEAGASSDIRHIVLDFGANAMPVLEGQTIGIVSPGLDVNGRARTGATTPYNRLRSKPIIGPSAPGDTA
jgi:hypothetical protein